MRGVSNLRLGYRGPEVIVADSQVLLHRVVRVCRVLRLKEHRRQVVGWVERTGQVHCADSS